MESDTCRCARCGAARQETFGYGRLRALIAFFLTPPGESFADQKGLEVHFDPASAQRAKGIVIDWVSTVQGEGLSLKFPGAPEITSLSVHELKARLAAGSIVSVRPPHLY